jgi:hypothetical protein
MPFLEKAGFLNGLRENVLNRNFLLKCSKNAKKAGDKAHSLS